MNRLKLDIQMFSDPYVDFKDYPDTTTPINASNLNKIQTDARDELIDRTTGDMVVESIRTKNMFDSSTLVQGDAAGSTSTARVSTRQILYLSAGTYTFSTNMPSTYRYGILIRPSAPPTSTTSSYDSGWQTSTSFTFTISTPGYFMMNFAKTDNTNLTPSDINAYDFQFEKGSIASSYSAYQNLNPYSNSYSDAEIKIGTWVNNKPLYRKVYSITNPSSSNTNYADLSSLNIETVVRLYGYYKKSTSGTFGIPFYDSDSNYSAIFINTSNQLRGRFGTASEITDAKVVIEYTKTTD